MSKSMQESYKKEKIAILIDLLNNDTERTLCQWTKDKASFVITSIYTLNVEDVGKFLKCGLQVKNLATVLEEQFDDFIIWSDDFEKQKQMLVKKYGFSEKRIADRTSIFFLPDNSNIGSISIDSIVPTGCLIDINFLFQNGYLHCKNDLERFYFGKSHRLINKWLYYFEIYERLFSKYRNKKIKMLEIGVFKGGSLQMWKDYFGKDATIVGLDINPECKFFEEEGIHIEIGSQEDRAFLKSLLDKYGQFDIILDDGGHTMKQQIISFEVLYPGVKWGGVYLCEDCHTSYWRNSYYGGFRRKGTFIEFMKKRVDDLNAQHIEKRYIPTVNDKISTRIKHSRFVDSILKHMPGCILRAAGLYNIRFRPYANVVNKVWSIQFYDSIVVLEKRKLGRAFTVELLR